MFLDARTVVKNTTINADVCIVGGGAAGITLARELIGQSTKVCLLESGSFQYDFDTQALYRGTSVGFPYLPLEATRLRFLGGTTNHWGGASRPLDEMDFQARDWVAHSGWPFDRSHLVPYYERAQTVLQLGPFAYNAGAWTSSHLSPAPFSGKVFRNAVLQQSPPTRVGLVYRTELERATNVHAYLNANALEIHTVPSGHAVTRLRVSSLARNEFYVKARIYVLAAGGIENARLLLLSDKTNHNGVGNSNGLVGRFFMDHPIAGWSKAGEIAPLNFPLRFYGDRVTGKLPAKGTAAAATLWGFITPSENTLRTKRLLNCGLAVRRTPEPDAPGIESARRLRHSLRHSEWPEDLWSHVANVIADIDDVTAHAYRKVTDGEPPTDRIEVMYWAEPQPNPNSRVYLSNDKDAFGQRRVVLDWRLTDQDRRTLRETLKLFAAELGGSGIGRLRIDPAALADNLEPFFEGSFHHMGTTRMHQNPKQGVVDASCRMHEVSNLYMASSSVFPATGHANPTLTIVALALRLAEHIKDRLNRLHEAA